MITSFRQLYGVNSDAPLAKAMERVGLDPGLDRRTPPEGQPAGHRGVRSGGDRVGPRNGDPGHEDHRAYWATSDMIEPTDRLSERPDAAKLDVAIAANLKELGCGG